LEWGRDDPNRRTQKKGDTTNAEPQCGEGTGGGGGAPPQLNKEDLP
jgi:hypothetical protein